MQARHVDAQRLANRRPALLGERPGTRFQIFSAGGVGCGGVSFRRNGLHHLNSSPELTAALSSV
jgi:hypothetical protein